MTDKQKQNIIDICATNLEMQIDGLSYEMTDEERLERLSMLLQASEAYLAISTAK